VHRLGKAAYRKVSRVRISPPPPTFKKIVGNQALFLKKIYEIDVSGFFLTRFNAHHGLDYIPQSNDNEFLNDTDVDVYGVSGSHENLNLQVKTGEPGLEAFWGSRHKHGSGSAMITVEIQELLAAIIQTADQRYSNKKELILLLGERHQPSFDEEFARLIGEPYKNSLFKGIYLVKLPFNSNSPLYKGQVIALKGVFGEHGIIF
jgi:hypothetical protein